ncbi:lysostaphin resistance A-like protein [Luteococcus sp. Sow4_B9]|uniref:CPBP family intramembrane glutamic endopeptidase n=1 Tax=Luteococcus sp. Sow4_B9 TaxID=3438792 RepID=UPI003F94FA36
MSLPVEHPHLVPAPRPDLPDAPAPGRGWLAHPVTRAVAFLGLYIGSAYLLAPFGSLDDPLWVWVLIQLVCSIGAYLAVAIGLEGRTVPHELDPRRLAGLGWGLLLGAAACTLVFVICWAAGWRTIDGTNPDAPLVDPLLQLGVAAGITEEILFRGILFRLVERGLGTWGSLVLSALLFGLAHVSNPEGTLWGSIAIALEAGLVFGLLYAWTRSLWWVIGVHAAWNVVLGPVLGSAVSGATPNGDGVLVSHPAGPELLSGGVFGLEASLAAVVVWLAVSVWILRRLCGSDKVLAPAWRRRSRAKQGREHLPG